MFDKPPRASKHCRHYSYRNDLIDKGPHCAKGCDMGPPAATLPCMPFPKLPCPLREEYTDAERSTWEAWRTLSLDRVRLVMAAIPKEGIDGEFPCPACKIGTVRWRRAERNKHLAAQCSTRNCFGVIQ